MLKHIAIDKSDLGIVCITEPCRILGHGVKYRLNISWRARNDAQDFTRRGLLLQRFFQFLEQPHILDSDYRLVGEGFEEFDLFVGKRSNFGSSNKNHADRNAFSQEGRGKYSSSATNRLVSLRLWKLGFGHCQKIVDVNRLPVDYRAAVSCTTTDRRTGTLSRFDRAIMSRQLEPIVLNQPNHRVVCGAHLSRVYGNSV